MDSQYKTLIVFSHAAMIVVLMVSFLWISNSWNGLGSSNWLPLQEQSFFSNPSPNLPHP